MTLGHLGGTVTVKGLCSTRKTEWPRVGGSVGWSVCHPILQKVVSSIPHHGTYLGYGFGPELGLNYLKFLSHIGVSLSLSLSLKSIDLSSG